MITNLIGRFNLMRVLRLLMGVIASGQAYITGDWLLGIAGLFLVGMAVLNVGCCGVGGCRLPATKVKTDGSEPVEFEELR
jgi:hypothetical protein